MRECSGRQARQAETNRGVTSLLLATLCNRHTLTGMRHARLPERGSLHSCQLTLTAIKMPTASRSPGAAMKMSSGEEASSTPGSRMSAGGTGDPACK